MNKRERPLLPRSVRSAIARKTQLDRIPTEPHPDNVRRVAEWRAASGRPADGSFEGFPSVLEWMKAGLREAGARAAQANTGFVAWIGWESFADEAERRLEDYAKHADRPVSPKALQQLRRCLRTLRSDLAKTRPF
jgi:hypothetical protein